MSKVGVFVSYNHKDKIIADALVNTLTSISAEMDVFINHSELEGGDEYDGKIAYSIRRAQWFIIICSGSPKSGKNMNWCFYEAGQFRAKLESENQVNASRGRMIYLYDGNRPSQLARYQGIFVAPFDRASKKLDLESENDDYLSLENTELYGFLEAIIRNPAGQPLRNLTDPQVRRLLRGGVRRITRAFIQNQTREPDRRAG